MLVEMQTVISRAKRRGWPILNWEVSSLEILYALLAAVKADDLGIITIPAHAQVTPEYRKALLSTALLLIQTNPAHLALSYTTNLPSDDLEVLSPNLPVGLTLSLHSFSKRQVEQFAALPAVDVLAVQEIFDSAEVAEFARVQQLSLVCLPTATNLGELQRQIPALLLVESRAFANGRTLKVALHQGLAGLCIGQELEEAFTAGLRTGLHNRSQTLPAAYQRPAQVAIQHLVKRYQV